MLPKLHVSLLLLCSAPCFAQSEGGGGEERSWYPDLFTKNMQCKLDTLLDNNNHPFFPVLLRSVLRKAVRSALRSKEKGEEKK